MFNNVLFFSKQECYQCGDPIEDKDALVWYDSKPFCSTSCKYDYENTLKYRRSR
jgi:endogenous inhibitor of DNA gyrase (YacG/DUF329 family)